MPLIAHDITQEPSRHGIAEPHQRDKLVKALHHKICHHLEDEESSVFQLAGKVLSEAEKLLLTKDYEGGFVLQRLKT